MNHKVAAPASFIFAPAGTTLHAKVPGFLGAGEPPRAVSCRWGLNSEWREGYGGPGRKFYSITPEGGAWLAETAGAWQDFTAKVAAVLTTERDPA